MNRKTMLAAAAAIALAAPALTAPAYAAPGGHGMRGLHGDVNKDGNLTLAEARAAVADRFTKMDANGDGGIDEAERTAMREKRKQRWEERRQKMAEKGIERPERPNRGDRADRPKRGGERSQRWNPDTDGDGLVTLAEMEARAVEHFQKRDTDGDGIVAKAEQDAARAAMKARWEARKAG